jgi:hypothetical protein
VLLTHWATALLAPLFSRGKQAFLPSMAAIQVGGGGSQLSSSCDRSVSRLQATSLPACPMRPMPLLTPWCGTVACHDAFDMADLWWLWASGPHCCPVQETAVDSGGRRSCPGKAKRSTQQEQQQQQEEEEAEAQQGAAAEGPAPECSWGEVPVRLARVGLTENDAVFGTRLRWAGWGLPPCRI